MKLIVIKTYLKEGQSSRELYTEFVEFAKSGRVETNKCRAVDFINQGETEVYVETCRLLPGERLAIGMEIDHTHIEQTFRVWEPLTAPTMRTLSIIKNIEGGNVTGSGQYSPGEQVTIAVDVFPGFSFTGWYANGQIISTENNSTIDMPDYDLTLEAHFEEVSQENYSLSIDIVGPEGCYVYPSEGAFAVGHPMQINAYAPRGYMFNRFEDLLGNFISANNPYYFYMPSENVSLRAFFVEAEPEG